MILLSMLLLSSQRFVRNKNIRCTFGGGNNTNRITYQHRHKQFNAIKKLMRTAEQREGKKHKETTTEIISGPGNETSDNI